MPFQSNSLDLINLYQHPDSPTASRPNPIEARGDIWTKLDSLLHKLARRNLTVVAGDFNCPINAKASKHQSLPADHYELKELIQKYHLGSARGHDGSPTFIGAQGSSSIDHILIPGSQMDSHCRLGKALHDFPVASWCLQRDHLPVLCSLPLNWRCWYHRPKQVHVLPKASQQALHEAWQAQHSGWIQVQNDLTQHLNPISPKLDNLPQLVSTTLQRCHQLVRTPSMHRKEPVLRHRSTLAQMWHSYALIRKTKASSVATLFQVWKHCCRLRQLKHRLSKSCKLAKVQRLQKAVTIATEAADRHDVRTLFATIRGLTPKPKQQPYRAIRLKGTHGVALTALEECQQFEAHFSAVFTSETVFTPSNAGPLHELPFTQEALAHAFAHAPLAKAASPTSLPHLLLRMLSEPLSALLWPCLHEAWCQASDPEVPQAWRDAWLVLLAKRAVRCAKDP